MKVGIYMPAYNVEKYIVEAVESIKKQTFENWELVILDDCSTDNTYNVAKSLENDKIKVFKREKKSGKIGQLKNESIKLLGEPKYMCHVGSDDIIPNHSIKLFVDYLEQHPEVGACCGNFECFDDNGKRWIFPHVSNSGQFDPNMMLSYMCAFPLRFYRYDVLKDVGFYSNELTSAVDYDLNLKICEKYSIHRIKEPITYYYRQHAQQVSTKARPEQNLNAKKALEDALKRRGIQGKVINDAPPFKIKNEEHFIWGKK